MRGAILVGAVLLVGYGVLAQMSILPAGTGTSQAQSNQIKYEEVAYEPIRKEVVLLGSSLTQNLNPKAADFKALNVGIGGGNSMTPLIALDRSGKTPKLVMIELGMPLLRGVDEPMLEKLFNPFTRFAVSNFAVLRQEYQPVNVLATKFRGGEGRKDRKIPPAVREAAIRRVLKENSEPLSSEELQTLDSALDHLRDLTKKMQAKGSKVAFYFVPGEPEVELTDRRVQLRAICVAALSDMTWVPAMPIEGWRTNDGIHIVAEDRDRFTRHLRASAEAILNTQEATKP